MLHELFLTTRQTTKMSQIFKIIQSGGSFHYWLANFGKRALRNVAISLATNNLPGLVSNLASNATNKFEIK